MFLTPPFVKQQSPDACAVACLRMILALEGIETTEPEVIQAAAMEPGGLNPEEIAKLARKYGLRATERQLDHDELFDLIHLGRFPIVILYRGPIDDVEAGHAMIAVRRSPKFVTLLDPLRGERRLSIRKFEHARRLAGQWVVIWESAIVRSGEDPKRS